MKLSIVIPFYQYKNYLKECFVSLKDSSFQDFETVLILDKNSEDVKDLVDEYKECLYINVYECDKHGVTYCRNLGIEKEKNAK
ncbi:MAG: glycosyltransferase, partial [Holdemanella sp.]|nr:glycosyltransferase [Holdemanella sp.]